MRAFLRAHGQLLINLYWFITLLGWVGFQTHQLYQKNEFGLVEGIFAFQNLILAGVILLRERHRSVNPNLWHQAVALIAFFSWMAFLGHPARGGEWVRGISSAVTLVAHLAGIACLLNLGRSFGILIALREVKTGGLYSLVRHPMYGSDILLRIGFVIGHFSWWIFTLFLISSGCYLYRAILEERYLSQQPEYLAYKEQVRYRFLPYIV